MVTTENTESTEIGTEKLNSFFMLSIVGAVCSVVSVLSVVKMGPGVRARRLPGGSLTACFAIHSMMAVASPCGTGWGGAADGWTPASRQAADALTVARFENAIFA